MLFKNRKEDMNISLKTLIQITPFPKESREMLLKRYDELNDDDKFELSNFCWQALSIQYYSLLKTEKELLLLEIQSGKRKYNPNDFQEIKAKLTYELAQKLQHAQSNEQIEDVRKQLEKYKTETGNPKTSAPLPHDPLSIGSSSKT